MSVGGDLRATSNGGESEGETRYWSNVDVLLLIDNYDSFAHNLARYFVLLQQEVVVWRNDDVRLDGDLGGQFNAIVLSPGPGTPQDAGRCLAVVRRWSRRVPILGVCLGHQVIYEALGGTIVRAQRPMHGKASAVLHDGSALFAGIPNGSPFGRYHSLVADPNSVPPQVHVTARSEEGEIMAIQYRDALVAGVQFHPESILSPYGRKLLQNFLVAARLVEPAGGDVAVATQPSSAL